MQYAYIILASLLSKDYRFLSKKKRCVNHMKAYYLVVIQLKFFFCGHMYSLNRFQNVYSNLRVVFTILAVIVDVKFIMYCYPKCHDVTTEIHFIAQLFHIHNVYYTLLNTRILIYKENKSWWRW